MHASKRTGQRPSHSHLHHALEILPEDFLPRRLLSVIGICLAVRACPIAEEVAELEGALQQQDIGRLAK